ncbi:MAG: PaaI family thioesterase [Desulfuromonas sp.]|nr:MAG: PaaI family thioesterase [Desulfuromonas sp.]
MSEIKRPEVEADGHCFVCGQSNETGLKAEFTIDRQRQSSHCRLRIAESFQGWSGVAHGGILSSLLDEACVYACLAAGEQFVTAELTVKFRKPVAVDSEIVVTGQLVDRRRRVWQATSKIEVDGVVHAEATAKIFPLDR